MGELQGGRKWIRLCGFVSEGWGDGMEERCVMLDLGVWCFLGMLAGIGLYPNGWCMNFERGGQIQHISGMVCAQGKCGKYCCMWGNALM